MSKIFLVNKSSSGSNINIFFIQNGICFLCHSLRACIHLSTIMDQGKGHDASGSIQNALTSISKDKVGWLAHLTGGKLTTISLKSSCLFLLLPTLTLSDSLWKLLWQALWKVKGQGSAPHGSIQDALKAICKDKVDGRLGYQKLLSF